MDNLSKIRNKLNGVPYCSEDLLFITLSELEVEELGLFQFLTGLL